VQGKCLHGVAWDSSLALPPLSAICAATLLLLRRQRTFIRRCACLHLRISRLLLVTRHVTTSPPSGGLNKTIASSYS